MSDREQLAELIRKTRWHRNGGQSDGYIANAIIAAGWRLVPEGAVVVSREDVQMVVYSSQVSVRRFAEARARLIAALEDADA